MAFRTLEILIEPFRAMADQVAFLLWSSIFVTPFPNRNYNLLGRSDTYSIYHYKGAK